MSEESKVTKKEYRYEDYRVAKISVDESIFISVRQLLGLIEYKWLTPSVTTIRISITSAEHADQCKDALDMAMEIFEKWSEDTGKEVSEEVMAELEEAAYHE